MRKGCAATGTEISDQQQTKLGSRGRGETEWRGESETLVSRWWGGRETLTSLSWGQEKTP